MFFNYFFPDRNKITRDELVATGLGYVFDAETSARSDGGIAPRGVSNGPGGQHGLIVSLSSDFCGYYPTQQTWKQEIDCEYWVGMWTDPAKRPRPETLKRDNIIEGADLRLDDGHLWTFPKARHFEEFDGEIVYRRTLPAMLTRDEAGRWVPGKVKGRYRELWRLASQLMQAIADSDDEAFSEIDDLVLACFQCNYKIAATELDLLGIYDDHVRVRVPRILLDMDGFDILFKKKLTTLVTGSSSDGLPDVQPVEQAEGIDRQWQT